MRQKIIKLAEKQFRVFWEGYEKQGLRLDFTPICNQLELNAPTVLLHWQGRPFGLRRWGVYCWQSDQYYGVDHDKLNLANLPSETYQIPEKQFKSLPTAVLVFRDCFIKANGHNINLVRA